MTLDLSLPQLVQQQAQRIAVLGSPAVAGLYDLTSQRLVRFATTITRNQHDAEDAVASALLKIVADPEVFTRANHPWPFLLQIVRNDALQILRRKKRWATAKLAITNALADLICPNRVDGAEKKEASEKVWLALRQLPTEQAEVVVLKIWEELTFQEISWTLEIPLPTAASRYRYAIAKLSEMLGHQIEDLSESLAGESSHFSSNRPSIRREEV